MPPRYGWDHLVILFYGWFNISHLVIALYLRHSENQLSNTKTLWSISFGTVWRKNLCKLKQRGEQKKLLQRAKLVSVFNEKRSCKVINNSILAAQKVVVIVPYRQKSNTFICYWRSFVINTKKKICCCLHSPEQSLFVPIETVSNRRCDLNERT